MSGTASIWTSLAGYGGGLLLLSGIVALMTWFSEKTICNAVEKYSWALPLILGLASFGLGVLVLVYTNG